MAVVNALAFEPRNRTDGGENMANSAKSHDVPLDSSVPTASLESILCTEELQRRPSRPPDYEKENQAPREAGECVS